MPGCLLRPAFGKRLQASSTSTAFHAASRASRASHVLNTSECSDAKCAGSCSRPCPATQLLHVQVLSMEVFACRVVAMALLTKATPRPPGAPLATLGHAAPPSPLLCNRSHLRSVMRCRGGAPLGHRYSERCQGEDGHAACNACIGSCPQ